MKKTILSVVCGFLFSAVYAQVNDLAFGSVRYRFTHITDTTHPNEPHTENMILLLGKKVSAYQSFDKMTRDSAMAAQMEAQIRSGARSISIGAPGASPVTRSVIYKDVVSGKQQRLENMMGNYLIEDTPPEINWTILPDTRNFNELVCQKATARFKGRNYTAWFCSQLPYSNGPWKLGGLPGLILEAYDDKKEVVFAFESFEDVSGRKMDIKSPPNATPATQAEFAQLQDAFKKDPQGFMKSRMAGSGVSVGNISSGGVVSGGVLVSSTGAAPKTKVFNNPIEKPEQ